MSVKASLEGVPGFAYVLHATDSARDKIYNIGGGACDVALGMVRDVVGVAGEGIILMDMYPTHNASVGGALKGALLYGRGVVIGGGKFSSNNVVLEVARASVG